MVWVGARGQSRRRAGLHLLLRVRLRACSLDHDVGGHALPHMRPCNVSRHSVKLALVCTSPITPIQYLVRRAMSRFVAVPSSSSSTRPPSPPWATPPLSLDPLLSFGYLQQCAAFASCEARCHASLPNRCVLAIIWVNAAVPETKGRTLEEIEALLVKGYKSRATNSSQKLLNNDSSSA